jgi:hypothetical protein
MSDRKPLCIAGAVIVTASTAIAKTAAHGICQCVAEPEARCARIRRRSTVLRVPGERCAAHHG